MIDPIVRRATTADAAQLDELEREARAALVGQRGGDRWLVEHPAIDGAWGRLPTGAEVLVGTIDDVVIAYLIAMGGDDAILRIDQVWVTPEARELGFGDELLARAIEHGRSVGLTRYGGRAGGSDRRCCGFR